MFKKALFGLAGVMAMIAVPALAGGPGKDTLVVTGLTDSNGFTPTLSGNPSEYFYATTVPSNAAVADVVPVLLEIFDTDNNGPGQTYTITMNAVGQLASAFTFDSGGSFTMTDPSSSTKNVYINTTNLAPGDYHANVQIDGAPANALSVTHSTLHFLIHVVDAGPAAPLCYFTDSEGLLLTDCSGNPTYSGGEFLVVSNQKKITATNPGQFYYNFIWTNQTGHDVTFSSLGLTGNNVSPSGANSVHVLVYNASQFTANFDAVNQSGTPCGKTGTTCKSPITVHNGETLWLTWHLQYTWIGWQLWPDIPPAGAKYCGLASQHGTIWANANLESPDLPSALSCSSSANGQNIK
jgi:hypothetical protein